MTLHNQVRSSANCRTSFVAKYFTALGAGFPSGLIKCAHEQRNIVDSTIQQPGSLLSREPRRWTADDYKEPMLIVTHGRKKNL